MRKGSRVGADLRVRPHINASHGLFAPKTWSASMRGTAPRRGSVPLRVTSGGEGVVEKPGPGSERVPFVLHGHRIDFTLSSRRRSNATEKRAFVSKGATFRCAPALPRYGARARLLGMREECRRWSNASDEGLLNNPVLGVGGMEGHAAADTKPARLARERWTHRGSSRADQALQRANNLAARAAESRLRLIAAAVR